MQSKARMFHLFWESGSRSSTAEVIRAGEWIAMEAVGELPIAADRQSYGREWKSREPQYRGLQAQGEFANSIRRY
jgi:hypothetical protein